MKRFSRMRPFVFFTVTMLTTGRILVSLKRRRAFEMAE
jgi:hypothetical protein